MGKKYLLTIEIPDYRFSIENVELSSPVQHNASPDKNSRTTLMVSFLDVTDIKPYPDLSPNQNALRIASGTEPTLIRKEDTTPLISCPVFVLSAPLCRLWAATTNLSISCTCGLERFLSARSDTFVDSELCSYTGDALDIKVQLASAQEENIWITKHEHQKLERKNMVPVVRCEILHKMCIALCLEAKFNPMLEPPIFKKKRLEKIPVVRSVSVYKIYNALNLRATLAPPQEINVEETL
ncbi:uncharacterized protein TNCV_2611491 [Trichonephila clavipes]|nr:uncharacterized protein TNCV_2611491 [Trichonephila clavipes]